MVIAHSLHYAGTFFSTPLIPHSLHVIHGLNLAKQYPDKLKNMSLVFKAATYNIKYQNTK